jgi:uncharacterized membrane protein YraQ (UPF0718 family)
MAAIVILGVLASILSIVALRRSPLLFLEGLGDALHRFVELAPRMAVAMLLAGFVGKLIPGQVVAHHIGADSGLEGILLATVAGGFVPSGPILAFPVIVVLMQAGAGYPQVVAFLTAWSVFALHRVMIYEIPIMGWSFAWRRLAASLPLPPIAGVLTMGLMKLYYG